MTGQTLYDSQGNSGTSGMSLKIDAYGQLFGLLSSIKERKRYIRFFWPLWMLNNNKKRLYGADRAVKSCLKALNYPKKLPDQSSLPVFREAVFEQNAADHL